MPEVDAIVIGGGITGLTAAYDLTTRGRRVALLEASARIGGLVHTHHLDGFTIDAGAESLLAQKPAAIDLCRELGLGAELQDVRPPGGAFVLRGRGLYRLPAPSLLGLPLGWRALLRYRLLPPAARARLALEPFVPARRSQDDEAVASFFRRRFGAATVDLIAQPLLGGIHAGDIEGLSMQSLFPRLVDLERAKGHVLPLGLGPARPGAVTVGPRSAFQSLRGGMDVLTRALAQKLGASVRLNARAVALARLGDRWRVDIAAVPGEPAPSIDARVVLIAAPAYVAADLLAPFDEDAARLCREVPYVSTISAALAWPRAEVPHALDGTGFVVARKRSDVRITACTWVSSKWEHRAPEGMALLRAFAGGAHDPDIVDRDDETIVAIVRRDLRQAMGISAEPVLATVHRWRRAGAQHTVGQRARVEAIERRLAAHAGLFVAGSGFRAVGIPDCVSDARAVAARAADIR